MKKKSIPAYMSAAIAFVVVVMLPVLFVNGQRWILNEESFREFHAEDFPNDSYFDGIELVFYDGKSQVSRVFNLDDSMQFAQILRTIQQPQRLFFVSPANESISSMQAGMLSFRFYPQYYSVGRINATCAGYEDLYSQLKRLFQ